MARVLRVVSWNLHGAPGAPDVAGRFARVVRWILETAAATRPPDLICLQEVWTPGQEGLLRDALGERYAFVGTAGGPLLRKGGLLALVRREGELRCAGSRFDEFVARASAWRIWEGDGLADKGVQRLDLRCGGVPLVAFHTHLQAGYPGAGHAKTRAAQLGELAGWMARAPASVPALALGDLNVEPDEVESLLIARDPRWRELSVALRARRECWSPPDSSGREEWTDYALGRSGEAARLSLARSDCMPSRPRDHPFSDHPGLDFDLAVEPAARHAGSLVPVFAARLGAPQSRREWLGSLALLVAAVALRR